MSGASVGDGTTSDKRKKRQCFPVRSRVGMPLCLVVGGEKGMDASTLYMIVRLANGEARHPSDQGWRW